MNQFFLIKFIRNSTLRYIIHQCVYLRNIIMYKSLVQLSTNHSKHLSGVLRILHFESVNNAFPSNLHDITL